MYLFLKKKRNILLCQSILKKKVYELKKLKSIKKKFNKSVLKNKVKSLKITF